MTKTVRLAAVQINPCLGDIDGNAKKILNAYRKLAAPTVDMVVFPELAICGYPPQDLILRPSFVDACMDAVTTLAKATLKSKTALLVGSPWRDKDSVFNAALVLDKGKIIYRYYKQDLPNYGVFDEKRLFHAGGAAQKPLKLRGRTVGILICEDMWSAANARFLRRAALDAMVVINASPFETGKTERRLAAAQARVRERKAPLLYVNQVGGQDELVFDGHSFALNSKGDCVQRLARFQEDAAPIDLTQKSKKNADELLPDIYAALTLGLRDYVHKSGFKDVILGLSGGVDSALVATIAVDALGSDHVRAVLMPSPYTAARSITDARELAKNLHIKLDQMDIKPAMDTVTATLAPLFRGTTADVTEENIQPRLRGLLLMALSNKKRSLLLTTGNKSELATGYATLYGDMCGAFNVLKDVYKTQVYDLCRWRNTQKPLQIIPSAILARAPTAELRANQTDQDTLPPYDVLDDILYNLIEEQRSLVQTAKRTGRRIDLVTRVWHMLKTSEYKRSQAAIGVKISPRAFGRDWRYPLTNHYKG